MKRLFCPFILLSFFVGAVPPIEQIHLLVGARFCIPGGKVIDDNPFFTPLAGAIAWHSGLITGLVQKGPFIAEKLVNGSIYNSHAITRLAKHLFADLDYSIAVSNTDHSFVINQVRANNWPFIVHNMNEMSHETKTILPADLKTFFKDSAIKIDLGDFKKIASHAIGYTIGPTKDLPAAAVWLLMSAVWYACVDTLEGRTDIISTNAELQKQFESLKRICEKSPPEENAKIFLNTLNDEEIADEIVLALLLYNRCGFGYPGYLATKHVLYRGTNIPDCVESTIHNIMNFLVYDPDTRMYAPEKYLPKDARVYSYYIDHLTVRSHLDDKAVADWFELLQEQPRLTYEQSPIHQELSSSWENINAALTSLILPSNISPISQSGWQEKIRSLHQTVSLINRKLTITKKRVEAPDIILNAYVHVGPSHAELRLLSNSMLVTTIERIWSFSEHQHLVQLLIDRPMPKTSEQLCAVEPVPTPTDENCSWRHLNVYASPTAAQAVIECFKILNTCLGWKYNSLVFNTAKLYIEKRETENDLGVLLETAQLLPSNPCTELAREFIAFKPTFFAKVGFTKFHSGADLINLSRAVSPAIFFKSFPRRHEIDLKTVVDSIPSTERSNALRAIVGNPVFNSQLGSISTNSKEERFIIDVGLILSNIKEKKYANSFGLLDPSSYTAKDLRLVLGIDGMCNIIHDLLRTDEWLAGDMHMAISQLTDGMSSEGVEEYAKIQCIDALIGWFPYKIFEPKFKILLDSGFGAILSKLLINPRWSSLISEPFFDTIAQKLTVADKVKWLLSDGLLKKTEFIPFALQRLEETDLKSLKSKAGYIAYYSANNDVLLQMLKGMSEEQFWKQFEDAMSHDTDSSADDGKKRADWAKKILSERIVKK